MRQYGSFLMNLLNDHSGQTVLHQADQLDRLIKSKSRTTSSAATRHLSGDEIFQEDTAVITISCADNTQFGVITTANMGACNMFGCSVGDLVGAPLSSILPAPFNTMHDGFLHGYLQAEQAGSFMNRTQHVFTSRRNGTIFPVAMRVRQVSAGLEGSSFLAVIAEVKVAPTEHFLLYDAATSRVKAVSAGCAALLELDAQSLNNASSAVTLDSVLPALKQLHAADQAVQTGRCMQYTLLCGVEYDGPTCVWNAAACVAIVDFLGPSAWIITFLSSAFLIRVNS